MIAQLLSTFEKTLDDFNLPQPAFPMDELKGNQFIVEQLDFNVAEMRAKVETHFCTLNDDQLDTCQKIMQSCALDISNTVDFIDGLGGIEKMYLENLLLKPMQGQGNVALAVASSGIAALLLSKGKTAHSQFKISIDLDATSICNIQRQGNLAKMIQQTKLILWDEALMINKFAFKAVDCSLCNITNHNVPFGGITFVMCGDFRQILPIVPKGLRPDIVVASIKESYLWKHVHVCKLRQNMRAATDVSLSDLRNCTFANWLLALGERRLDCIDENYVQCPKSMVVCNHTLHGLINTIYLGSAEVRHGTREYFSSRAILAAQNDDVAQISTSVLDMVLGQNYDCLSADKIDNTNRANAISIKYLNMLGVSGWPLHKLSFKVGTLVMLLQNLDPSNGLCNGTRLIVRHCSA